MLIRAADECDLPQITAIYEPEVREGTASYEVVAPDVAEIASRWKVIRAASLPYLAAEIDGVVAGFAYASAYRARAGYRWTIEDTVYVARDHQGRGVGRALLERLIRDCEAKDFRQMIAVIGDAENTASIGLHRRLGFLEAGRFEGLGRKQRRWLTSVQMLRPLRAGVGQPPSSEPDDP
jgi:phosphinothricin acetyltransferase